MKRQIRRNVFETNSSSTHSISIYKWQPTRESKIPVNSELEVDGYISSQTEIKDEVGKLNYIVVMLASILDHEDRDYDNEPNFEEVINSNMFVWLKEIIKEQRNTNVIYKADQSYFPYFETTYDENNSIREILECDVDDEKSFKSRISEIIFDENIIIEDKENEY